MKRVMITGANGYIGGYLQNTLKEQYHIIATDIKDIDAPCDLLERSGVVNLIDRTEPGVIVHCAGTKDLFECERDPASAYRINVETTRNLVDAIRDKKIKFIFLSSDYVFSGGRGMYREEDLPDPKTVYGNTKLMCERYIRDLDNFIICRTANVYGEGSKFFSFILNSLKNNRAVEVYNDSYFSPTYIGNLSEIISNIIDKDIKGILHTAGRERISRYNFALKMAQYFQLDAGLIKPSSKPKESPIADDTSLDVSISMRRVGVRFMGIDEGLLHMRRQECIL